MGAPTVTDWSSIFRARAAVVTFQPRCSPSSVTTLALAAGIPERDVMISARHTSSAQTARYDRLRDQVERTADPRLETWLRVPSQTGAPCRGTRERGDHDE